jgi:hypothetical protein
MAKKIILTEEQLKRITSLINEDFDSHIYDLILDKYNEVGIGGMDEDEVAYLKSGGETDIPSSFKESEKQSYNDGYGNDDNTDDDKELGSFLNDMGVDTSDYDDEETQVREVSELLDVAGSYNTKKTDTHVAFFMNFDEKIYNELKRIFGGLNTKDNFGNEIKILLTDNKTKIALVLPLSWEDKLFGEDV